MMQCDDCKHLRAQHDENGRCFVLIEVLSTEDPRLQTLTAKWCSCKGYWGGGE